MAAADFLEQQLKVLADAAGDPALLALATVDLAHASLDESQRRQLKDTLEASAVPHWIDEPLLAAMIGVSAEESAHQLARLRALRVLEPFPARGYGAVNVHQASRKALRKRLRTEQPERFAALSARAREALLQRGESVCRIDALYHFFALDQEAAATEWERIDREIVHPAERETVAAAMDELLAEGWLTATGKTVALVARGNVQVERGDYRGMEASAREAVALAEGTGRKTLLGLAQCLLGDVLAAVGKTQEAAGFFRSYLDIFRRLRRREPRSTIARREVAVAHSKIADVQEAEGRFGDARRSMQSGLSILKTLVDENPDDADLRRQSATAQSRVADLLRAESKGRNAIKYYRLALDVYAGLTRRDPTNFDWQLDLASAHTSIGIVLQERSDLDGALAAFRNSLEINQRIAELVPDNAGMQRALATSHAWVGSTLRSRGELDDSMPHLSENVAILARLHAADPERAEVLRDLAVAQWNLSVSTAKLGRRDEAVQGLRRAEEQLLRAMSMAPAVGKWQQDLENIRGWIALPA
jgi:tetratricopeptide (TPR) repeat protein